MTLEEFARYVRKYKECVGRQILKLPIENLWVSETYGVTLKSGIHCWNFYVHKDDDTYKNRLVDFLFHSDGCVITSVIDKKHATVLEHRHAEVAPLLREKLIEAAEKHLQKKRKKKAVSA